MFFCNNFGMSHLLNHFFFNLQFSLSIDISATTKPKSGLLFIFDNYFFYLIFVAFDYNFQTVVI